MKDLFIFIAILSMIFILSCSKDEEEIDSIIGMWEGESIQQGLGAIQLSVNISSLTEGSIAGNLNSFLNDLSQCDTQVYSCTSFDCATQWRFLSKSGNTYKFFEENLAGSECTDGNIQVSLQGTNRLTSTWSLPDDPSISNQITLSRSI